jgi:hypothetical protein
VSITKRLLDVARANLTDFRDAFSSDRLRDLLSSEPKDPEVEREIDETIGKKAGRRAREFKDAAEDAWDRAYENARSRAGVRGEPPSDPAADRRRWYRDLEVEPGADFKTVRKAYRKLLLQYHPDRFEHDAEKQKAATEVTRKVTEAYNGLRRYLGG